MDHSADHLIHRAIEGDAEALTTLLHQHEPCVRRAIAADIPRRFRALLGADDVLQQTYIDAIRGVHGFDRFRDGSFEGWLLTLARRNLLDAVRMLEARKRGGDRRRAQLRPAEESYVDLFEVVCRTSATPSRAAARHEASRAMAEAIESLPGAYRQVIQGYDIAGRSAEAVALEIGRSVGAMYMLRARALRLLAELLGSTSRHFGQSA